MAALSAHAQEIRLVNLRCAYRVDPSGVDGRPFLSWELQSSKRGVRQSAYRILVSTDSVSLLRDSGNYWDSDRRASDSSIGVRYAGPALSAGRTYYWKVMVWDNARRDSSRWSHCASWQTGLWSAADWDGARWIGYDRIPDSAILLPGQRRTGKTGPGRDVLPILRKSFGIDKPVVRATIFISGLGQFELRCDGEKVGDHFLDPGWVAYDKSALYVALDVTRQLKQGENVLGVMLGNGFYYIPRERYHKLLTAYGYPKVIAVLQLEYTDGTIQRICTDSSWRAAPGPIRFSSIYGGEDYDARLEQPGWDRPGFAESPESGWRKALLVEGPPALRAQEEEPLKVTDSFPARRVLEDREGAPGLQAPGWVYDMGQNASGTVRIAVSGRRGATVRLIPAELIAADSSANQRATGRPYYWEYTLKGDGVETWAPRFSYYGFRYVEVAGAVPAGYPNPDGLPVVCKITSLHTRNSMAKAGNFDCSDPLLNRTDSLIDWAIQSNLASVFTDCPHREKLGWLEQDHLMGSSIRYGYDMHTLARKAVHDMMEAQTPEGLVPEIAPEYTVFGAPFRDSPEWGSSAILLPWYLYKWYGDQAILAESYPMMLRYIDYLGRESDDHLLTEGLGDWYDIGPARPGLSQQTPRGVTATAIYYYDLTVLEQVSALLGRPEEAGNFRVLAAATRTAFNHRFFDPRLNEVAGGSQTADAMALYVGLVPDGKRDSVLAHLVRDIHRRGNGLTAGDIGFRYVLQALDEGGRPDLIFAMNSRTDVPGYGYQLAHGATALTESWQALPSVSNDHLMLGHLLEWLYQGLAGIRADDGQPAFHHAIIRPEPVGAVQWARAGYHSPYGLVSAYWKRSKDAFELDVTIPGNTTATVCLPATAGATITEGWRAIADKKDIRLVRRDSGTAIFAIGSGHYYFRAVLRNAVTQHKMELVYRQIRTPYKYGLVLVPPERGKKMDCPTIFRKGKRWYMSYIIFDGRGYETWLAGSDDLLHWTTLGKMLSFGDSSKWDGNQKAGYFALVDHRWGGDYRLHSWRGKYWMSYFGGNTRGYEAGTLSEGMAFTDQDPARPHEWQRLDRPILTVHDTDVAWWDDHTMYKSWVVWDKDRLTGHRFDLFYNANGDSADRRRGSERIGLAVSDDMVHWKRLGRNPVLDHLTGITGDPYIQKIGNIWVMFYFGAFWHGMGGAFNRFACSYDLVHWTDWTGPDLIRSSEPYDEVFAHKSAVIRFRGTVYHFYCAVDKRGDRGIALATSKDVGKSGVSFH